MSQPFSYAAPLNVDRPEDCFFYHKIKLPGVGEVGEGWDLRSSIDAYLGKFDFRGKRVLDMGAASGFLTFEMEKRGAEVVSFDMADGTQWDIVPHYDVQSDMDSYRGRCIASHARLKNAYWFTHKCLGSKARVYYGDIYDLPGDLGEFDVAMFGMILGHLRDPFQALYSASRLVKDTIIITNQMMDTTQPPRQPHSQPRESRMEGLVGTLARMSHTDAGGSRLLREKQHDLLATVSRQGSSPPRAVCLTGCQARGR